MAQPRIWQICLVVVVRFFLLACWRGRFIQQSWFSVSCRQKKKKLHRLNDIGVSYQLLFFTQFSSLYLIKMSCNTVLLDHLLNGLVRVFRVWFRRIMI